MENLALERRHFSQAIRSCQTQRDICTAVGEVAGSAAVGIATLAACVLSMGQVCGVKEDENDGDR